MNPNTGHPDDQTPAALDHTVLVGPGIDPESWRLTVPASGACYLLQDADDAPILLATVANLRAALTRRLAPSQPTEDAAPSAPSRRIDYHRLIRSVRYRPVCSRFEADWVYLQNAYHHLPHAFDELTQRFGAHWLHIDPSDTHPRFVTTDRPQPPAATCFGPLPNAKNARRFVQALEDLFDLCREHRLLLQTPNAKACDYKAMGRCPAPCDGSIPFDAYRRQLQDAIDFITKPQVDWLRSETDRMHRAAAEQDFEAAQQAKQRLRLAKSLDNAPPPLTQFRGLILAPGPATSPTATLRAFGFAPGSVQWIGDIETPPTAESLGTLVKKLEDFRADPAPHDARLHAKQTALIAWHTLHGKPTQRALLTGDAAHHTEAIRASIEAFVAQKNKPASDAAGVLENDSESKA